MREQVVLHVDLDCFYAAVEMRDRPELRHVPLVVGADPREGRGRGVVCTANYPARRFGIRSAMPISEAWRRAPHAVFVRPDWEKIGPASDAVMDVLAGYADVLEVVGVDEAYLDVTSRCRGEDGSIDWALAGSVARSLQAAVTRATGLSISVGAAASKSVAKVASDFRKPHGVTVVPADGARAFLAPLGVRKLPGCGPKTAGLLAEQGIRTVAELAGRPVAELRAVLGSHADWLRRLADALDDRAVVADHGQRKSRSNERTYLRDEGSAAEVSRTARRLAAGLCEDQQGDGRAFQTVTVKLRYADFTTLTRAHSFAHAIEPGHAATQDAVLATVERLLAPLRDGRAVRLVGVRLSGFRDATGQQGLARFGLEVGSTAAGAPDDAPGAGPGMLRANAAGRFHPGEGVAA